MSVAERSIGFVPRPALVELLERGAQGPVTMVAASASSGKTLARELLERHPRYRTAHGALIAQILDVLSGRSPALDTGPVAPARDPLSDAELRVLRYLPTNLSTGDIAGQLYVSVHTVKTHMRHIYAKLDAHSRTAAVTRARALGMLGDGRSRG